ncbi:hypothetical protein ScPMuIL_011023 [Solemya velum]
METCAKKCFKMPCHTSCNRVLLRCLNINKFQRELTEECWGNKAVCVDRCPTIRVCSGRCRNDFDWCLATYEPDE